MLRKCPTHEAHLPTIKVRVTFFVDGPCLLGLKYDTDEIAGVRGGKKRAFFSKQSSSKIGHRFCGNAKMFPLG